jgi:DNA sulfur modification protein DndB
MKDKHENADSFSYVFSALRGTQAGRDFYVAMCPLKLIPKIFLFDEDEIPAELRAQRALNKARVPEIARYIVNNPREYVFSSITACIDGKVRFESSNDDKGFTGKLIAPMTARFIINDGQHRRAAIEEALKTKPELGDETISVVFFTDGGLRRSQQMFADLNKHAIRPTKSLGILYDFRDPLSQLSRKLIDAVPFFDGLTETEKTTISNRSRKLFTLSAIHQGTQALLDKQGYRRPSRVSADEERIAIEFWTEVGKYIPEWRLAVDAKVSSAELRRDFVHAHALALHSLGIMGHSLLASEPKKWKERLAGLNKINWTRSNTKAWEGRAMIGGRVSKAHSSVLLTAALLKRTLNLTLSGEEQKLESALGKGN